MANIVTGSPLGQQTQYISAYSPELLFPIARQQSRQILSLLPDALPFFGMDLWTGYELSWLDERGKPVVAVVEFQIPCVSEFIVESKSFKLYLNSFNQSSFSSAEKVQTILTNDISNVVGVPITVRLEVLPAQMLKNINNMEGVCLDDLPVEVDIYTPEPGLLKVDAKQTVEERLFSHLFKSNCPVTGQPDWASVQICYAGPKIEHESLLRYIVSFREHQDFHEHCVERMFVDILARCKPKSLSIYARYTRRGGLDINPFRTTESDVLPPAIRLIRQ